MRAKDPTPAERLAEEYALEVAHALAAAGGAEPVEAEAAVGGWRVTVRACPTHGLPAHLTPCERDVCLVLRGQRRRLTTSGVLAEMERRKMVHGATTIRLALAKLSRLKVIESSRVTPRGYLFRGFTDPAPGEA